MNNRIIELFKHKDKDILNIFCTAGYPQLNDTVRIIETLAKSGVDLIEIGMPYSDPLADGLTIQLTSKQALENGMTLEILFQQVKEIRQKVDVPIILMGYFNQLMQYGVEKFCKIAQEVGVDGLIIPDLPPDIYEETYQALFEKYNLAVSFLITPQSTNKRIALMDKLSQGFVYMVSSASTTGAKSDVKADQLAYFKRIDAMQLETPRLIGFGISNRESFQQACQYSNGAIIGSAFLNAMKEDSSNTSIENFIGKILNQ